ncbi:hypothetical protein AAFF_G00141840 [Aldrovandia affinis]|uniref:Uncharacterized protein n=1 Tax=Aldrovandia affinis TaxID=143900 RepID=A0AAD7TCJ4_9TELE|nr:hypothetical protein AAFF_G00141840 [Aldrovandia affinis]
MNLVQDSFHCTLLPPAPAKPHPATALSHTPESIRAHIIQPDHMTLTWHGLHEHDTTSPPPHLCPMPPATLEGEDRHGGVVHRRPGTGRETTAVGRGSPRLRRSPLPIRQIWQLPAPIAPQTCRSHRLSFIFHAGKSNPAQGGEKRSQTAEFSSFGCEKMEVEVVTYLTRRPGTAGGPRWEADGRRLQVQTGAAGLDGETRPAVGKKHNGADGNSLSWSHEKLQLSHMGLAANGSMLQTLAPGQARGIDPRPES